MACLAWSLTYSLAHLLSSLLPQSPYLPPLPTPLLLLLLLLHTSNLLSCLPLLLGILLPQPLLLLPWLVTTSTTTAVETGTDIFLTQHTQILDNPDLPVTAFFLTICFFLLALQVQYWGIFSLSSLGAYFCHILTVQSWGRLLSHSHCSVLGQIESDC